MPIAIKNSIIDISSEETTRELAKNFSNYLIGGEVIFLYGEMGVGKTTFIKYLINLNIVILYKFIKKDSNLVIILT